MAKVKVEIEDGEWEDMYTELHIDIQTQELDKLYKKYGKLTPDMVVKEAKKKSSPLHQYFEWNDTEAALQWRKQQARVMIHHIKVIREERRTHVREYIRVPEERCYKKTADVIEDPDDFEFVVHSLAGKIAGMQRELDDLKEMVKGRGSAVKKRTIMQIGKMLEDANKLTARLQ